MDTPQDTTTSTEQETTVPALGATPAPDATPGQPEGVDTNASGEVAGADSPAEPQVADPASDAEVESSPTSTVDPDETKRLNDAGIGGGPRGAGLGRTVVDTTEPSDPVVPVRPAGSVLTRPDEVFVTEQIAKAAQAEADARDERVRKAQEAASENPAVTAADQGFPVTKPITNLTRRSDADVATRDYVRITGGEFEGLHGTVDQWVAGDEDGYPSVALVLLDYDVRNVNVMVSDLQRAVPQSPTAQAVR